MQYQIQKKKYKSFILSCIVHGIILLILMYFALYQVAQQDISEPLRNLMPAPISLAPRQQRILPLESPTEPEELSDDPSIPFGEQLDQFNTLEAPYQEVAEPNKEQQESNNFDEREEHLPEIVKESPEGNFPTREVSPKEFIQAFREALRQEHPSEAVNDPETLVQQRLGRQWGQASYASRVAQALNRSFRANARSIKYHEFVNRHIVVALSILKDGTPEELGNQPLSGIAEVDRHIRRVVRQADFPPIPDRLQADRYQLQIAVQLVLKDGAIMFGRNFEVSERNT